MFTAAINQQQHWPALKMPKNMPMPIPAQPEPHHAHLKAPQPNPKLFLNLNLLSQPSLLTSKTENPLKIVPKSISQTIIIDLGHFGGDLEWGGFKSMERILECGQGQGQFGQGWRVFAYLGGCQFVFGGRLCRGVIEAGVIGEMGMMVKTRSRICLFILYFNLTTFNIKFNHNHNANKCNKYQNRCYLSRSKLCSKILLCLFLLEIVLLSQKSPTIRTTVPTTAPNIL